MGFKDWQQWGKRPDESERHNIHRLSGELPDMECTNQLVKIISEIHTAGWLDKCSRLAETREIFCRTYNVCRNTD